MYADCEEPTNIYARTSLRMVALVIVPVTQFEKWDVAKWKLWEQVGIIKGIWDKDVSCLGVDEEMKRLVEKGNSNSLKLTFFVM